MKIKDKDNLLYFIISVLIVGILTTIVTAHPTSLGSLKGGTGQGHIGDQFTLTLTNLTNTDAPSAYCIQHGKHLWTTNIDYIVNDYVEIDGKKALVYRDKTSEPKEVINNLNAEVAYILNKKEGYGAYNKNTEAQNALWYIVNSWTNAIFGSNNNIYRYDKNPTRGNDLNTIAKEYADWVGDRTSANNNITESSSIKVEDKTNKKSLAFKEVTDKGTTYYRVGPFKWIFDGTLSKIVVEGDNGIISDSNLRFVQYEGTTPKIVSIDKIKTNEAFYIDINKSAKINMLKRLTLSTNRDAKTFSKIYIAKVWFLKSSKSDHQNIIYVDVGDVDTKPDDGIGTSEYNVYLPTILKLGIVKVDDRDTSIPLVNVGFRFKATIETYDRKELVQKHMKHIDCDCKVTVAYTDGNGVFHDVGELTHEHEYHESKTEVEWYEYSYWWQPHEMYLNKDGTWDSEENAYTFKTDSNGKIGIDKVTFPTKEIVNDGKRETTTSTARLKAGTKIIAIEVSNPYHGYYDDGNYPEYPIDLDSENKLVSKPLENHQSLVDLSGYVWIDEQNEKTSILDNEYGDGEKGLNGVKVILHLIGPYGEEETLSTTTSNNYTSKYNSYDIEGGKYLFKNVSLDTLEYGKSYVEFEYCGIKYQAVQPNITIENGSKAGETNSRNTLDNAFKSVDGTGTQKLYIKDEKRNVTVNYQRIENYQSTYDSCTGCEVYANTKITGYNLYEDGFEATQPEIININLGLFKKAQTDYALAQDLYNVKVDVNGFSHIYKYSKVRYDEEDKVNEENSWNLGVKFQKNNGTYDRAIYKADSEYAPNHKDNELKVYVTYKIALRNESTYNGKINSIVDYCDSRYTLFKAGTSINEESQIEGRQNTIFKINEEIDNITGSAYNSKYKKYIINTNIELGAGETKFLYVQFKMDKDAVLAALNDGELLNNVTEINSYTTFKDNGNTVAVIDKDSVPGNAIPGHTNNEGIFDTYEDDTDAARSLKLELRDDRVLTGKVFVDSTGKESDQLYTNDERRGNGIYDTGETTLEGIKVTLHEVGKDDSTFNGERGEDFLKEYNEKYKEGYVLTNKNGDFIIEGYIPGDYIITYTWGDETYKVQYYKGTIYSEDRLSNPEDDEWYKKEPDERRIKDQYWYKYKNGPEEIEEIIRYTDAIDNYKMREDIDNEMEYVKTNILENEINKAYKGEPSCITKTQMDSTTPIMSFSVEHDTTITDGTLGVDKVIFAVNNVDFGIVERPKQKLDLTKRISNFKITLANGQTLVDANVSEDGRLSGTIRDVSYMKPQKGITNGFIRAELDNEIIEGATLEATYVIKVTNIGELDYVSDKYYYYGNKRDSDMVRASVTELLDYLDDKLSINDNKWDETPDKNAALTYFNTSEKQKDNNKSYINSVRTYLTTHLSRFLAPTETHTVELNVSKLLTSANDNTFDNKTEIVEVTKPDTFNSGTPVKVNWNNEIFNFEVADSEKIIIIPSTGENRSYTLPIIIGITTLLILGAGTIVIKKFIIDK